MSTKSHPLGKTGISLIVAGVILASVAVSLLLEEVLDLISNLTHGN